MVGVVCRGCMHVKMNSTVVVCDEGDDGSCEDVLSAPSFLLLLPVLCSVLWICFQLLYGSWLLAALISRITNLFLEASGIYIGSLHFNLLTGGIVFKDFHYYCRDYSLRVSSGHARVHWWRPSCKCCPSSTNKLAFISVVLDGFEYHWYNRSEVYDNYGKRTTSTSEAVQDSEESGFWLWWKEVQPALHFSINKGRILMGNHHLERSLLIQFSCAEAHYSTEMGSTQYDEYMHCVNCNFHGVKVLLDKSFGSSTSASESPPPMACEGTSEAYVLLKSDTVDIVFSQDSPGLVPLGTTQPPKYAVDVRLGNDSVVNYGCYANRQRKEIVAFFFPVDHTEQAISRLPQPGERRIHTMFDISVSTSSATQVNLVFSHHQVQQHLTLGVAADSNLSIHVPWVTSGSGSTSTVKGQLLDVSVKSSLPYEPLGSGAAVSFNVALHFPRVWNAMQTWTMQFTACKVQANILFAYVDFVNALLDDWVGQEPNDLLNFVPVDWTINIDLIQYEIFLFTNRYNWLDLLEGGAENTRLAFCGSTGHISFHLPFTHFIPMQQKIHFSAKGEDLVVRHYAPPSSANRESLFALSSANRYRWRTMERPAPPSTDDPSKDSPSDSPPASSSRAAILSSISTHSRPPVLSSLSSHKDSSPEKDSAQLIPPAPHQPVTSAHHQPIITAPVMEGTVPDRLRMLSLISLEEKPGAHPVGEPLHDVPSSPKAAGDGREGVKQGARLVDKECFPMGSRESTQYERGWLDLACGPSISIEIDYCGHGHNPSAGAHTPLLPSQLHVDIQAPVVLLRVFGCLARDLLALKENYPGEFIKMSTFSSSSSPLVISEPVKVPLVEQPPPDPPQGQHMPQERTMDVFVKFTLRKIVAEFPTDLSKEAPRDFPLPSLCTDILCVEVAYRATDTTIQLHVDPVSVHVPSMNTGGSTGARGALQVHHDIGHVVISSIDVNSQCFNELLCQERVEYAFLIQLLVGRITGALSSLQLMIALDWFYATFTHTLSLGDTFQISPEGEMIIPKVEPASEDIKYRLFNLEIAGADVHLCEADGSITRLQSAGLDLELCTLHSGQETMGLSWQLQSLTATCFLPDPQEPTLQLQVALMDISHVQGNMSMREPLDSVPARQLSFLKLADGKSRRLWFLWQEEASQLCGCCGGCAFMDSCITRKPVVDRWQSAMYSLQFFPLTSVPRHLALHGVNQALASSSVAILDCMWSLHRGLVQHYQARYHDRAPPPHLPPQSPTTFSQHLNQDDHSSKVDSYSDEMYMSARSSLTSLLAEDYKSVSEVNDAAVEEAVSRKTRHKRKPSNLSVDLRACAQEQVDAEPPAAPHTQMRGLSSSHFLHTVTLKIPFSQPLTPTQQQHPLDDQTPTASHPRFKVHHRQSASDTSFLMRAPTPEAMPSLDTPFHVYIPCLVQESPGKVPILMQKGTSHTLERRRRVTVKSVDKDDTHLAKFLLSIQICASNTVLFSPSALKIMASMTESVEGYFKDRSVISILNWTSFSTVSSVSDQLSELSASPSLHPTPPPTTPLLRLHLFMSQGSFFAVQLLQSVPRVSLHPSTQPDTEKLSMIAPHHSLFTLYVMGLSTHLLVLSSLQQGEEFPGGGEGTIQNHQLRSIKLSAQVNCPVLQANLSVLLEKSKQQLLGLVPAQQQLDFSLKLPPATGGESQGGDPGAKESGLALCNLLEAGVKDVTVSAAAHILKSAMKPDPVLTWKSLEVPLGKDGALCQDTEAETRNQLVYADISLPVVWCQLASPPCGVPHPASSGVDLLVLHDTIMAWRPSVEALKERVLALIASKSSREKGVLLTLIADALNSPMLEKPMNPVLAQLSSTSRETVLFSCLHHMWRALPIYSEIHVPVPSSDLQVSEDNLQLVAMILALASKLYLLQGMKLVVEEPEFVRPVSPASSGESDKCSIGTVGYISISPSPSFMAMPNRLFGGEEESSSDVFSTIDFKTLAVLREALIPFFSTVGIQMDHQLQVPSLSTSEFVVDFTVELREVTIFAVEHVSPSVSTYTTATTPTLLMEQLLINGRLKHNTELTTPSPTQKKTLLLPTSIHPSGGEAKVGVVCDCAAAVETVRLVVTAPLLKLTKHINVTGKLRRKALKQALIRDMDAMQTPLPTDCSPPISEHNLGHVKKLGAVLVSHLEDLQGKTVPRVSVVSMSTGRLVEEYRESPKPAVKAFPALGKASPCVSRADAASPASSLPVPSSLNTADGNTFLRVDLPSSYCSSSEPELSHTVIGMEDPPEGTSPEDVLSTMDTCGEDTTDSQHIMSSENEGKPYLSPSAHTNSATESSKLHSSLTYPVEPTNHAHSLLMGLRLQESQLLYSVFGLLKVATIKCEVQIETTNASLELSTVSAAIDTRNSASPVPSNTGLPLLSEVLPTYLSVAATLKTSTLRVNDKGLPDTDLLLISLLPIYASVAINNSPPVIPTYRCLLRLSALNVDMKQSAVKVHKRFQQLMPTFTTIYRDIFGEQEKVVPQSSVGASSTSSQQILSVESVMSFQSHLPQGFLHLTLDKAQVYVAPLPSLNVTYTVAPVSVKAKTVQVVSFHLMIGDHKLRFNPKEQHKDELSLRFLALPRIHLQGKVIAHRKKLPQLKLDLFVKQLNIDVTTDVLNQLLIVQNTFIKELNDLVQMLTSIGESLPTRERMPSLQQQPSEVGLNVVSFLESCRLSLAGIAVTVSTPLSTAIRFATGKIEMNVTNTSSRQWSGVPLPPSAKNQLSIDGRVEIDINLALGYLQDTGTDVADDLRELAYFRTRISLRNTLQNLPAGSEASQGEVADTAVDTFLIAILSPHLYLQSSAVEQAILFWLNCKSVYSYWQNERKLLNVEVRRATDAFIEKINRPNQFQAPSIDFSKPRLVQISVSDVGACMPIIPVPSTQHNTQRSFPALVVTIKDMHFLLNLSHKVASTGRFQTFCIRFAEQFSPRHKIWTLDPRKHKLANFGTITRGTFSLCIATKKRYSESDPSVIVGERLLSAFQWDMSGIEVHANTAIGHHTSTLVRTMTSIASDLDGQEKHKVHRSSSNVSSSPKSQSTRYARKTISSNKVGHKRSHSVLHRSSHADNSYKEALEQKLAKQTRKVQQLRYSGAAADNLRMEEAILRSTEQELARTVQRIFRHPRTGLNLHTINQLFSPRAVATSHERGGSVRKISAAVRTKLFSLSEERDQTSTPSSPMHARSKVRASPRPLQHRRYKSDVTGMKPPSLRENSTPSPTSTPPLPEDELDERTEDAFEDSSPPRLLADGVGVSEMEGFSLPSIDLEFDITVNVDHGKIVLRTEESALERSHLSSSSLLAHSPLLPTRLKSDHKHTLESVVLIPALIVKAHYHSIVGPGYSNLSSSSPLHQHSPSLARHSPPPPTIPNTDLSQPLPHLPVKRGVLSLSAVIESLPEDIKLTHSLLEFIEQVARPTLAATVVSSSSSTESLSDTPTASEDKPGQTTSPISFPVDVTLTFHIQPSTVFLTCQPHSQVECIIQSPDVNFVISFSLFTHQQLEGSTPQGTSPTCSTAGQNSKIVSFNNLYVTGCLTTFVLQLYSPRISSIKPTGNKEALSLTLGQALVHLSRKSVLSLMPPKSSTKPATSVDDYATHNKLQVSVITSVASLVLGYDMRRLNDITAFRRCWYRTSLVEALFIGSKKNSEDDVPALVHPDPESEDEASNTVLDSTISAAIVVAASVDDFRVAANFAQVMGNADLLISCLKCVAHCDVSRDELVLLQLQGKLEKGELDARAGIIAGSILMNDAIIDVTTQSQQGCIPEHRARAVLSLVEGRVDYMSACILLSRATHLQVHISDLWEGLQLGGEGREEEVLEDIAEQACIQVKAEFTWQEMQLAIHRSTTQHFFNIVEKMYDFIMQQKRRSERTLSTMLPAGSAASKALEAYRQEQARIAEEVVVAVKEHSRHHWLWAIKVGGKELMHILGIQPPKDPHQKVSLGGNISILGQSICIVCFHGPSFRDTERAVFNIDQISASFSTHANPGLLSHRQAKASPAQTHLNTCQQTVQLCLGGSEANGKSQELAAIYRVSSGRARVPNITGTRIQEWLAYACIDTFLHEDKYISDTSTLVRMSRKLSIQPVLLVPAFSVTLTNNHFWPIRDIDNLLPCVECTLTSDFSDGISVTTTVDHYLFLHDVVKGYIDYLEKHRIKPSDHAPVSPTKSSPQPPAEPPRRHYKCMRWELNPHLRLMSTVSGQFNPHISWLLEKLGFSDAQTTIPKWIQRGAMDPLDKVVAMTVELLVKVTGSKKEKLILQLTSTPAPAH